MGCIFVRMQVMSFFFLNSIRWLVVGCMRAREGDIIINLPNNTHDSQTSYVIKYYYDVLLGNDMIPVFNICNSFKMMKSQNCV